MGNKMIPHLVAGIVYYAIILVMAVIAWKLFGRDDK